MNGTENSGGGSWDLLQGKPEFKAPDANASDEVPWSGKDVFVIVGLVALTLLAFALFFIPAIIALIVAIHPGTDRTTLANSDVVVTLLLLLQWAIMLGVAFTYLKNKGYQLNPRTLGFKGTSLWRAAGLVLLVLIGSNIFDMVYGALIENLFGSDKLPSQVPTQNVTDLFGTSIFAMILTFIAVAIVTPMVEELFFRGIVHRGLEHRYGFIPGALMSSFIFSLAHVDYRLFIPIFVLGFGLAFLVHRTGTIWSSISVHFLVNSVGVIAQFVSPGNS